MQWRGIAPIALILVGAVACTSSGSGGQTASPTSVLPTISSAPTSVPPTAPSTPASPSVATTGPNVRPGEKPPTLPPAGRTNTRVGSLEFGNYWMRTVDWAYATMSTGLARAAIARSCTDCKRLLDLDIDALAQKGQYYDGGRISILESTIQPNVEHNGSSAIIDVVADQSPIAVRDHRGKIIQRAADSGRVTFRTWLRYVDGNWAVVDWKHAVAK